MRPTVAFPDAVMVVVDYLNDLMDDPVVARIPNPRPDRFVRIRRTGGAQESVVNENAQLTIEGYGADDVDAFEVLRLARAHLTAITGHTTDQTTVGRYTEFSGPADLPDPVTDQARSSMTISLGMRGKALQG